MTTPLGDAVNAYGDFAGWWTSTSSDTVLPALELPLQERVAARADGSLSTEEWAQQDTAWFEHADTRYRASVERRALGTNAAPIRLAVKDTIDVAGFPTRLGLRHYRHHPTRSTAILDDLPADLVAVTMKSATTELNIGIGAGCVNPLFPHIDPGGSSTGSGVAVAAEMCDLALGTDVLGSVRWPAAHCGMVGLRMTHNPALLPGVFPLCPPMDAPGWVARSTEDLVYLWSLLGLDELIEQHTPGVDHGRIGLVTNALDGNTRAAEPMRGAVELTADLLRGNGHELVDVELDNIWEARGAAWQLCARQAWDGYRAWVEKLRDQLQPTTESALEIGSAVSDEAYAEILNELTRLRRSRLDLFETHGADVWLLPLAPTPPPGVQEMAGRTSTFPHPSDNNYELRVGYTPIASFCGLPAITLPVTRDERGAPLCIQLVGAPGSESALLRWAKQIEDAVAAPTEKLRARRTATDGHTSGRPTTNHA